MESLPPELHSLATALSDGSVDLAAMLGEAEEDLVRNAALIAELARGIDLVTVVSMIRMHLLWTAGDTGEAPSFAILELIALVLADRDKSAPPGTTAGFEAFDPRVLADAALDGLHLACMVAFLKALPADAGKEIVGRLVQRELMLRNMSYPHMLKNTLAGLFAEAAVNADCATALGYTAQDALTIMDTVGELPVRELKRRVDRLQTARADLMPFMQAVPKGPALDQARAAAGEFKDASVGLSIGIGDATAIDAAILTHETGLDHRTIEAVLDALTYRPESDIGAVLRRFYSGDNPLRTHPIVTGADSRRMLVHEALALPAVREHVETGLRAAHLAARYEHHRGDWVENAVMDQFEGVFASARAYRNVRYFVPDPAAPVPQTDLDSYTKNAEADGLIVVDDVAILVEVKANSLTAAARGGAHGRVHGKLRDIVTKAADQAARLRERILAEGRLRTGDGAYLDLSSVREVHTVAVSLEDLSGITTATATLVHAGVLDADNIPWTVSLHDLRVICEIVEHPGELLLYVRRRTHPEATLHFLAVDELDLYMYCLAEGLFVIPDPAVTEGAMPWLPPSRDAASFGDQPAVLIPDLTQPISAWYDFQVDNGPEAAMPQRRLDAKFRDLIEQILQTGSIGAVVSAAALLETDRGSQRGLGRRAKELGALVAQDRRSHRATTVLHETSGGAMLIVWECRAPGEAEEQAASRLNRYLKAKKSQTGVHRAVGLLFNPSGKRLLRLVYDSAPTKQMSPLQAVVEGLAPLDDTPWVSNVPRRLK
ncbi:hypothetical protein GCM10009853_032110 [Glycomyces scopariae]